MPKVKTEEEVTAEVEKMLGTDDGSEANDNNVEPADDTEGAQDTPVEGEAGDQDAQAPDDNSGDIAPEPDAETSDSVDDTPDALDTNIDLDPLAKAEKRVKDTQSLMQKTKAEAKGIQTELDETKAKLSEYQQLVKDKLSDSISSPGTEKAHEPTPTQLTPGDFKALKDEYPEIAGPIIDAFSKMEATITSLTNKQNDLSQNQADNLKQTESTLHFDKISRSYPDYKAINKSDDFEIWKTNLSPFERMAADHVVKDGSAEDIVSMFDKFSSDTGRGNGHSQKLPSIPPQSPETINKAKDQVRPDIKKANDLKLADDSGTLTTAEIKNMKNTPENVDKMLKAMTSGTIEAT